MKKITLLAIATIISIFILSSCQSHGPKCPGMYSQIDNVEVQNTVTADNID